MEPHERLKSWLSAAQVRPAEFARRCDFDRSNMHKVLNGRLRPSIELAFKIEDMTGGAVPAQAWVKAA